MADVAVDCVVGSPAFNNIRVIYKVKSRVSVVMN
jgi:hypothetical protein